jgi:hypothetical protein
MTRRQGADQLLLLAVTVSLIAAATSQDNGEKAAQLKSQVSGTLSDAQPFQAASTRVDASASQGLLASSTPVSLSECGHACHNELNTPCYEEQK